MRLNKLFILFFLLLARLSMFADIPLQKQGRVKPEPPVVTKYYFANVDSFANYNFSVKKAAKGKVYKIKQDAAFVVNPNVANNTLEVWAESKADHKKTNSFTLKETSLAAPIMNDNTVYVAISFYFDKNNKLNYKQTVLKPDCYSKKQMIPFLSFKKPSDNINQLLYITLFSFVVLLSVLTIGKIKQRIVYV